MRSFCILIIAGPPGAHLCRAALNFRIRITAVEPERNVNPLHFLNPVFASEQSWQKNLSFQMLFQLLLCLLLIQLERNNQIRLQHSFKLLWHNYRVAAVRTARCCCTVIRNDLAAAGIADICLKCTVIANLLVALCHIVSIPLRILCLFFIFFLKLFQCIQFKLRVAVRTLHFLEAAVELNRTAAARAFVFQNIAHSILLSSGLQFSWKQTL